MSQPGARLMLTAALCLLPPNAYAGPQSAEASIQQYSQQGQRALAEGRYPEAETAFEKLRELEPEVAEVYANLGLVYFQERKFEQAVPALRHALKLSPALPKLDTLLAMSLSELGQYSEALSGLEKGFHRSTDPAIKRMCGLQLERVYTGMQRDRSAVEVALELDRLYPNDPEVLYHNGKIYGNFAFLSMQRLAQAAPDSVWRHQAQAEAYESQGSFDAALSEYHQVLSVNPRREGIHYRLGRVLLARSRQTGAADDISAAEKEFEQELQLEPDNANAAYEIAEIHRTAGDSEVARSFFERAVRYYPDFEQAHLGLAAALYSLQKLDLAVPHLQKAIKLNPGNEVAWYRLAQAEGALGHQAEQQKAFAEFRRLRSQKASPQLDEKLFSPTEVTKQQLDPNLTQ